MMLGKFMYRVSLLVASMSFVACTSGIQPSDAEIQALQSSAFSNNFNVHDSVGDVHSAVDALPASRPFHVDDLSAAIEIPVRDCTTEGLYEMEKQMAITEALSDPTGQTVPVKFSYSFGRKHDALAKWANKRAALSESNGGITYVPVAGKKSNNYNGKSAYYDVDNSQIVQQYKTGERCFFSTVKVSPDNFHIHSGKFDFIKVTDDDVLNSPELLASRDTMSSKKSYLTHMIHFMYLGYCAVGKCEKDQAFEGEYANRLFEPVSPRSCNSAHSDGNDASVECGEPQIIKVYMADLRSEQMQHDIVRLQEDTVRGREIDSSISNILNVCEVHKNYHDVTKNLSLPKEVNGFEFDPIQGAVQLVENILSHDVDGTVLSSQYTPIVIDLDGDGVKTSSSRWGTYFNMAALDNDDDGSGQSHRTAWLGGDYVDYNPEVGDSRVTMDVRLKSTDGFLVVPDANGQVTSSTQMFGDNMMVGGKTFENGFLALQAFAGKNCESSYPEERYVGPWDGEVYTDKLRIWVDENRNGVSEDGEIRTLRDSGVVAINACHIQHSDEQDAFGNGTHLRSAVLMAGPYSYLFDSRSDALHHLQFGQGLDGEKSYFNLAIDLIFQVKKEDLCPGAPIARVDYPALELPDDETGISTSAPIPTLPPVLPEPEPTEPERPDNF